MTYLFAVAGVVVAEFPSRVDAPQSSESGLRRMVSGFRIAWQDRLVRRILVTMSTFSFFRSGDCRDTPVGRVTARVAMTGYSTGAPAATRSA